MKIQVRIHLNLICCWDNAAFLDQSFQLEDIEVGNAF